MSLLDIFIMIIIQSGFFAVLIIGLRFFFAQHLSQALKRLKAIQEEAMVKESQLNEELNRAKQHREAIVEGAREEADELLKQSKLDISSMRNDATAAAHEEKKKIIESGGEELRRLSANLEAESKAKAIDMAVNIMHNVISDKSMSALNVILVNEVVDEVEKLDESAFIIKNSKIILTSAAELSQEIKDRLSKVLKAKMNIDVELEEMIEDKILAGMTLTIGEFVIDGSLSNKISKVIPYLET